jgi:amino acid transporter
VFGRLHPTKRFPYVALIVLGVISIICSFFSLDTVIDALISTRILVQFIGQIFALILLRKRAPDQLRPYKMWLYPIPCLVALIGWIFIFATTAWPVMLLGLCTLGLGAIFFLAWSWYTKRWPFAVAESAINRPNG